MSGLVIPPSPNWYESSILICSPDNTLIYGARNDIVLIQNTTPSVPAEVKIIPRAHSQKVVGVNINKSWNNPKKYIVSVGQDKIVSIWNADTLKRKTFHNAHNNHAKVVAASFAGDERVVSVSEEGNVFLFNIHLNEINPVNDLFGFKVTVTCMSVCPHANWLTAFGLKNGLVFVTDLRKNGKVLYKLRGHDKSVVSLSWCPASVNIFPRSPVNYVGTKKEVTVANSEKSNDNNEKINFEEEEKLDKEINSLKHGLSTTDLKSGESNSEVIDCEVENISDNTDLATTVCKFENEDVSELDHKTVLDTPIHKIEKEKNLECDNVSGLSNIRQKDESDSASGNTDRKIIQNVSVEEEPRKEFLLASSAKESKIYIWRAGTDGRLQTFLTVPTKSNNRRNFNYEKMWITLHWATPTKLLSSSKSAELLRWTLPKPTDKSDPFVVIHNDHHSQLFSIAGPVVLSNKYNWQNETDSNVWTIGQERLLLNTSLSSTRENLSAYPTFGGSVHYLQLSPLDPNRLAIGTNDGFIKLMDLSRPHVRSITMSSFYQKIQSKVMSLAWHPICDTTLAYGTFEGRVGYIDISNTTKSPVLFTPYCKTQIHKVEYGPLNGSKEEFALYVLSEGTLLKFNPKNPKEDPVLVEKPDDTYIYTFSWKPDYSMLVITTKKNSLVQYSANLEIMLTKYVDNKIQYLCWHPDHSDNAGRPSKYCNYFAAVLNSKNVFIFNFESEAVKRDEMIVSKYEGQFESINCVSWSPYDPSHLAIASECGIGVIWDMEKEITIASYFSENFDPLTSMVWSPVANNLIISGAKDQTLRIWQITDYPPRNESDLKSYRKENSKKLQSQASELLVQTTDNCVQNSLSSPFKPKKPAKSPLLPAFYSISRRESESVADLRKLLAYKENPSEIPPEDSTNEPDILDVFGPNMNMKNLVKNNEKVLSTRGQYNRKTQLSLFEGDISSSIRNAITEKRVNPFIISLAPMVSPKVWQEACETYAEQLSQQAETDPLEIATYYLACHKVEEAINMLCTRNMFTEALVLAKCRFMDNDNTIREIIDKWAKYALLIGNFEVSAQCYIYLGKYEDAASVLFRRSDVETLKFAAELAEKCGNLELHKAVMIRYNGFLATTAPGQQLETGNSNELHDTSSENLRELPTKGNILSQNIKEGKSEETLEDTNNDHCLNDKLPVTKNGQSPDGHDFLANINSKTITHILKNNSSGEIPSIDKEHDTVIEEIASQTIVQNNLN